LAPAFHSIGQLLRFNVVLLGMLLLPPLMALLGPPSRAEVYRAMPHSAGPFTFIAQEIYADRADIDVLFDCDSVLWVGIDAAYFQAQLSAVLGRPATVVVLGANWPGMDQRYVLLRDMLTQRHVHMVVLSPPRPGSETDRPHTQAFRWLQFGVDPAVTAGLGLRGEVAVYAAEVLGAPRQLLSMARANRVYAGEDEDVVRGLGSQSVEEGFHSAPFVRVDAVAAPAIAPRDIILSAHTAEHFSVTGPPLSPYQLHFTRQIGKLLAEHEVPLTVLNVPLARERGQAVVAEQADWSQAFGTHATVIGVSSRRLFGAMSDHDFYRYYYDEHLNRNGSELFTRAITPALIEVYLRSQRHAGEH
jgi:hypothetical protein